MLRVIIAEDEPAIMSNLRDFINTNIDGFTVVKTFDDGEGAIEYIKSNPVDIIMTDVCMPKVSGIEIAKYVYENSLEIAVIFVSAYRDYSYVKQGMDYGVITYIEKPVMPRELRAALDKAKNTVGDISEPEINEASDNEPVDDSRIMEIALLYIQENFKKSDISLYDVSKHVYLSYRYFSGIFTRHMGMGFVKYLNSLRIEEAIRLLKTGKYTVKEISDKVGFRNCNYFIKIFKQSTGVTPKQYCIKNIGNSR